MTASDSIILEMFSRLQKCENNIEKLTREVESLKKSVLKSENPKHSRPENEDEVLNKDDSKAEMEDNGDNLLTRSPARELIMEKMRQLKPSAIIRVANRSEGSGIYMSDSKGVKKFKLYHSRSYDLSLDKVISWSGVMKDDVDNKYDGYIFSIWCGGQLYTLLFTHQQLKDLIADTNKICDTQDKYHFSFTIKPDLKVFETRGPAQVDVTYSFNNYQVIG